MDASPVVAVLAGGNFRIVQTGGSVGLDASKSYDPDGCSYIYNSDLGSPTCAVSSEDLHSSSSLLFAWSCTVAGVPCRDAGTSGVVTSLGELSKAVLNLTSLDLPSITPLQIIITVSVSRAKQVGGEVSKASVILNVTGDPTIDVQILPLYVTADQCAYAAQISQTSELTAGDSGLQYAWSVVQTGSCCVHFSPADAATFLAGTTSVNLVIQLNSPMAVALLANPGASFTVMLSVISSQASGMASIALAVPSPPSGGSCSVSPPSGFPLTTQFTIQCVDWSSDNLPLSYSYSFRSPSIKSAQDPSVSWSIPTTSTSYNLYLTVGNYSVAATIRNDAGASTVSGASGLVIVNFLQSSDTGKGVKASTDVDLGSLNDLSTDLLARGQIGTAVSVIGGVSYSINENSPASATCSSGSSCRRLFSSAAYRIAVRRLLFAKLAGVNLRGSPSHYPVAVLRAARQTAGIPNELDQDTATSAINQLIVALNSLTLRSLRTPGVISDAVSLAAHVLSAVHSDYDADTLSSAIAQVSSALEGIGRVYISGMVVGEGPINISISDDLLFYLARTTEGPDYAVQLAVDGSNLSHSSVLSPYLATTTASLEVPIGVVSVRVGASLGLTNLLGEEGPSASMQVLFIQLLNDTPFSTFNFHTISSDINWRSDLLHN